ncbi:MAG: BTAD domain-containing putative transcriptional regulator [Aeromicrobium sp.]|uniref:BTAD domain-containing putative transcriptional regulator n=1 Tax=Aeromicrobium sp. TaxID=1871063 RepID=UPI00403390F3
MTRGRRVEVAVLATVALHVGDEPVRLSGLERAVLARIALTRSATAASLLTWLYGEGPPASATNRVQALISGIRRKCPAPVIETTQGGYRLVPDVQVDVERLAVLRDRARELAAAADPTCLRSFREASTLLGDESLQDVPSTAAVEIERSRLDAERLALWEEHAAAALALGRADQVVADLATLTARHPFHEALLAQYVLVLASMGQQERALGVYREAYDRLDSELGVEPSARLREAHAEVLRGPQVPAPVGRVAHVPRTLPRRAPGFVGRGEEIDRIVGAVAQVDDAPLVVHLTGLAGMGKSALAVEVGQRLRDDFPDGSLHLEAGSAPVLEVGAVLATFLRLLGVHPDAVPGGTAERAALYRSLLDERRVLVVLDGVDAHAGSTSSELSLLLPASPGSMAIVCSRYDLAWLQPDLHVQVGPLSDASGRALLAGVLGDDRVRADHDGADRLVSTLGGMPLALRLAAGRARQRPDVGLSRLAERLSSGGPGTDDVAAALATSLSDVWERVPESVQEVARRVARLPVATFSAWVPGALLGDDAAGEHAIDALCAAHLVEPVRRSGQTPQFRLHDVVARFLVGSHDDDVDVADVALVAEQLLARAVVPYRDHPTQLVPVPPAPGRAVGDGPRRGTPALQERESGVAVFAAGEAPARAHPRTHAPGGTDHAGRRVAPVRAGPRRPPWRACRRWVSSPRITPRRGPSPGRSRRCGPTSRGGCWRSRPRRTTCRRPRATGSTPSTWSRSTSTPRTTTVDSERPTSTCAARGTCSPGPPPRSRPGRSPTPRVGGSSSRGRTHPRPPQPSWRRRRRSPWVGVTWRRPTSPGPTSRWTTSTTRCSRAGSRSCVAPSTTTTTSSTPQRVPSPAPVSSWPPPRRAARSARPPSSCRAPAGGAARSTPPRR